MNERWWALTDDQVIELVCAVIALGCIAAGVKLLRGGSTIAAIALFVVAALALLVLWFFASFSIRLM